MRVPWQLRFTSDEAARRRYLRGFGAAAAFISDNGLPGVYEDRDSALAKVHAMREALNGCRDPHWRGLLDGLFAAEGL